MEHWLDIGIAVLGGISAIIGILVAWRLLKPEADVQEAKPPAPAPVAPAAVTTPVPPQPAPVAVPEVKPSVSAVTEPLQKTVVAPVVSDAPVFRPDFKVPSSTATQERPALQVIRQQRVSPTEIRIVLQNTGATLIFLELISAEFNEVEIAYSPPIFRDEERYVQSTSMHISLKGQGLQDRTYHFSIRFVDLAGDQYIQEVAGMGLETPIVEEPTRVTGPVSKH